MKQCTVKRAYWCEVWTKVSSPFFPVVKSMGFFEGTVSRPQMHIENGLQIAISLFFISENGLQWGWGQLSWLVTHDLIKQGRPPQDSERGPYAKPEKLLIFSTLVCMNCKPRENAHFFEPYMHELQNPRNCSFFRPLMDEYPKLLLFSTLVCMNSKTPKNSPFWTVVYRYYKTPKNAPFWTLVST